MIITRFPVFFIIVGIFSVFLQQTTMGENHQLTKGNTLANLLRPPKVYDMSLSPDGKYAVSTAPIGKKGDRGIVIFDLKTMEIKRSFNWSGREIGNVVWTTNEDIAFSLTKWGMFVDGIYSVNVNRRDTYVLLGKDAVVSFLDPVTEESYSWIWIQDGYEMKDHIAKVRATGNAIKKEFSDFSLEGGIKIPDTNINPLIYNRIYEPEGEIHGWGIDQNHEPRIIARFHDDKYEFLHRYNQKENWKPLSIDAETWDLELFGADKNILYISGYNGEETKGLYPYNIETNEIGELIYRDDYYDFSDTAKYILHNKKLIGFRYMRAMPAIIWTEPEMLSVQKMIDTALPNRINVFHDSSDDFTRHLIVSYSDKIPAEYLLLDLKQKSLKEITKSAPWLDYDQLLKTNVFHFMTSDGLKLEGYLTRPMGVNAPYPTVCLVHGGPWSRRDSGGFHDETQLLASQGYAVIRVNYRGSPGYGKTISNDYDYAFRRMHDDITEAVKMAVKHGIADPNRLAIMGASFGGYAALCGAAFEPDLYQCAITNMGVFSWEELIKARKQQDHRYSYYKLVEQLGDPKKSKDKFEEISPIHHVEKIKIPILIIHGKDDKNVSIKQSKQLASALKKNGVDHKTLFIRGEGHNVFELKKRITVYNQIIDFLDENLK